MNQRLNSEINNMESFIFHYGILFIVIFFLNSCTSHNKKAISDSTQNDTQKVIKTDSNLITKTPGKQIIKNNDEEFEKQIYFQIDKIYTGKVYNADKNTSAFYRILIVPEEENIMIIAENIAVLDDEGENLKLRKLSRLTDDNSVLPKFGLSSADSIKFIDSVTIEGYFNDKKQRINLEKLKSYNPALNN